MFRLASKIYTALPRIFRLPGTEQLEGMQREGIFTQDLNRMMQADRVTHTLYTQTDTPAATQDNGNLWGDASDWTEVQVNGIRTTIDQDLPSSADDRLIISVGLHLAGTTASYTSAAFIRRMQDAAGNRVLVREFVALVASHNNPTILAPNLLPTPLNHSELTCIMQEVVSGIDCDFRWSIEMLSAEPGVLSRYPGV